MDKSVEACYYSGRVIRHTVFTLLSVTSISVTSLEIFFDLRMSRRHTSVLIFCLLVGTVVKKKRRERTVTYNSIPEIRGHTKSIHCKM